MTQETNLETQSTLLSLKAGDCKVEEQKNVKISRFTKCKHCLDLPWISVLWSSGVAQNKRISMMGRGSIHIRNSLKPVLTQPLVG